MGNFRRFPHSISSSRMANSVRNSLLPLFFLLLVFQIATRIAAQEHDQLYKKHCEEFVPAAETVRSNTSRYFEGTNALDISRGFYEGGDWLFNSSAYPWNPRSKSVTFSVMTSQKTDQEGVFKITGSLKIRSRRFGVGVTVGGRGFHSGPYASSSSHSPFKRVRSPKIARMAEIFVIQAEGFWSNSSHRSCMIGSGYRYLFNGSARVSSVSVRFSYPLTRTILTSFINGTVEGLDKENSFEPIFISAAYDGPYEYTRVEDAQRVCKARKPDVVHANIDVLKGNSLVGDGDCFRGKLRYFELELNSGCNGSNCSPFNVSDPRLMPSSIFVNNLYCSAEGKMHGFFMFQSQSWNFNEMTLIGEGQWDAEKGQLCVVACRVGDGGRIVSEKDCGISISMQFPRTFTVVSRNLVVGHVQSDKDVNDPMYFKDFAFRGPAGMGGSLGDSTDMQYNYTKHDKVKRLCNTKFEDKKTSLRKKPGRKYPDGESFGDLGFDGSVDGLGKVRGYASVRPFTIENKFHKVWHTDIGLSASSNISSSGPVNVSYHLQFWNQTFEAKGSYQTISSVSAEGVYDPQTGSLCMIGCRHVGSLGNNLDGNMDCEILIEVDYAPMNPEFFETEHLSGKISSLRKGKEALYFKTMKLSSTNVYRKQAEGTMWRKDLEIIMRLISLSFTALFIIAQLLYVKKHSTSLPFVSLLMLTVLTLGHMIPLVLNFEAFFMKTKERENIFQSGGGWLEVNEVVVRVMTMVAFLLQLRLLQLAWIARPSAAGDKSAWFWEKKVLFLCLPLYLVGGLIACLAHWWGTSDPRSVHFLQRNSQHLLWEDFRSYAGLVLDGFLLPQVLGNYFWDIREAILVPYFYIGITLVRSVPHAYDAYRVIRYIPEYSSSYYYANPDWDFYSTAWDIVIPCGAFLLAFLVFLQQRFGGRCVVPQKFRAHLEYEKIPIVDG
uniref:RING-type E3 ubiquitin transferase n=2 Tax=Wollemia nobilis TaxID=56998 RepID=A0A0C9RSM4_9CONI